MLLSVLCSSHNVSGPIEENTRQPFCLRRLYDFDRVLNKSTHQWNVRQQRDRHQHWCSRVQLYVPGMLVGAQFDCHRKRMHVIEG